MVEGSWSMDFSSLKEVQRKQESIEDGKVIAARVNYNVAHDSRREALISGDFNLGRAANKHIGGRFGPMLMRKPKRNAKEKNNSKIVFAAEFCRQTSPAAALRSVRRSVVVPPLHRSQRAIQIEHRGAGTINGGRASSFEAFVGAGDTTMENLHSGEGRSTIQSITFVIKPAINMVVCLMTKSCRDYNSGPSWEGTQADVSCRDVSLLHAAA